VNDKEKLEEIAQYIAAATDSRGLISSIPIKKILEE